MKGWCHCRRHSLHKSSIHIVMLFVLEDWVTFYRIKWWLTPASEQNKPTEGLWVVRASQNLCLLPSLLNNFLLKFYANFTYMYINLHVCVCMCCVCAHVYAITQNVLQNSKSLNSFCCEWFENVRTQDCQPQLASIFFSDLISWKKIHCQTPLYWWFSRAEHWISSSMALPVAPYYINYQTISSPSLWSFHLGKRGPVAVVYKLPLILCLVHSQHVVHASYHRSGLRLGHTRWTAAESVESFFFSFSKTVFTRFVAVLFFAACLSSVAALMFGHHLCLFWLSLGSWWGSQGTEGGRKECVRSHVSTHTRIRTRCGRECVPHLQTRSLIRPGLADGEDLQEYWDGWRDSDPERERRA